MSPNPAAVILRLQISLVGAVIMSGVTLVALFGVSLISFHQLAFQALWTGHLLVHSLAVGLALALLIHLARELTPGGTWIYLSLLSLASLVNVASALLPWTAFHSVSMQLPLGHWWLKAGRIAEMPWYSAASLPGGMIPAYTGFFDRRVFFLLSSYHASYVLVLAGLLSTFVYYKTHDEELSLWACLILMFCPFVVYTSGQPSDILPGSCYFGLAYGAAILWGEQRARWYWLIVPGLALGFALFVSAQAGIFGFVLLFALFGFYLSWKFSVVRAALAVLTILVCAAAGASLFLFRNFVWNGNPLYPLIGAGSSVLPTEPFPRVWFAGLLFVFLSLIPVFRKSRNMHRVSPWARSTWFVFLAGCACSWSFYSRDGEELIIPFLLPLLVLAAVGFEQIVERKQARQGNLYMRFSLAVHIAAVTAAGIYTGGLWQTALVVANRLDKPAYLARNLNGYSAAKAVTQAVPKGAGVFLVGADIPLYYLRKNVIGVSHSGEILSVLLREEADAKSFARRLILGGVNYVVLGEGSKGDLKGLQPPEQVKWREFIRDHCESAGDVDGRSMLRVRTSSGGL